MMNHQKNEFTEMPFHILENIFQNLSSAKDIETLFNTCTTFRNFIKQSKLREKRTLIVYCSEYYSWRILFYNEDIVHQKLTWDFFFKNFIENLYEYYDETLFDMIIENTNFLRFRNNIKTIFILCETSKQKKLEIKELLNFFQQNHLQNIEELYIRTLNSLRFTYNRKKK